MNSESGMKQEEVVDTFEQERQKGIDEVRKKLRLGEFRRRMRQAAKEAEKAGVGTGGKGSKED